jgi:hypothetical protein
MEDRLSMFSNAFTCRWMLEAMKLGLEHLHSDTDEKVVKFVMKKIIFLNVFRRH